MLHYQIQNKTITWGAWVEGVGSGGDESCCSEGCERGGGRCGVYRGRGEGCYRRAILACFLKRNWEVYCLDWGAILASTSSNGIYWIPSSRAVVPVISFRG